MPTTARSVAMALAMLRGVHLALGARSETGELAGDGAALAAGAGQGEATAACPQSLPELDALMEKLTPIYDLERKRMATAVKAKEMEPRNVARMEAFQKEADKTVAWIKQHPIAEKWKTWKPALCVPSGGLEFMGIPGDDCDDPLTREEEFALLWQKKRRELKEQAAEHKEKRLKLKEFKDNCTVAVEKARVAMDTVGSQLVDVAKGACDKLVAPLTAACARIPKMPEAFEVEQAGEALKQLDAVWASVAGLKDCLPAKWKAGGDGGACFEAVSG